MHLCGDRTVRPQLGCVVSTYRCAVRHAVDICFTATQVQQHLCFKANAAVKQHLLACHHYATRDTQADAC